MHRSFGASLSLSLSALFATTTSRARCSRPAAFCTAERRKKRVVVVASQDEPLSKPHNKTKKVSAPSRLFCSLTAWYHDAQVRPHRSDDYRAPGDRSSGPRRSPTHRSFPRLHRLCSSGCSMCVVLCCVYQSVCHVVWIDLIR